MSALVGDFRLIAPRQLTMNELANFHARDYLEAFQDLCLEDDPEKMDRELMEEYGLGECGQRTDGVRAG